MAIRIAKGQGIPAFNIGTMTLRCVFERGATTDWFRHTRYFASSVRPMPSRIQLNQIT